MFLDQFDTVKQRKIQNMLAITSKMLLVTSSDPTKADQKKCKSVETTQYNPD
jgi:hypothetical protein